MAGMDPGTDQDRLRLELDDFDVRTFTDLCLKGRSVPAGFVVTPNADHLIRFFEDKDFRALYAKARYVLLDSRFLAGLVRATTNRRLNVCPGSDLTASLFSALRGSDDTIILIGAMPEQVEQLRGNYSLRRLVHHSPPMGFIRDVREVQRCVDFAASAGPARLCFLALGSPQQEMLAVRLVEAGLPVGLVLCVGASINFLTGAERRAPAWLQRAGLEWAFRLVGNPRRLAYRYLVRGPRVFAYLRRLDLVVRDAL
jgi:exopolysaccharide biosynthesis WecB/TagA/CpsF family protein